MNSENLKLEEITTVLSTLATVLSCKIYIITLNNENICEIASKKYSRGSIHLAIRVKENNVEFFLTEFMKEALSNYCETIENLTPNKLVYDNHGRAHLHTPSAGRSYVFLRAQRFNGTTISTYITDLHDILTREENQKPGLLIMSDSGLDFAPTSSLNMIYYYRLFKLLDLDILNIFAYVSHYSAFNCIEHL